MVEVEERYDVIVDLGRHTSYYQPKLHESSFSLPLWVEKRIYGKSSTEKSSKECQF